jgi:hypothetical protein
MFALQNDGVLDSQSATAGFSFCLCRFVTSGAILGSLSGLYLFDGNWTLTQLSIKYFTGLFEIWLC